MSKKGFQLRNANIRYPQGTPNKKIYPVTKAECVEVTNKDTGEVSKLASLIDNGDIGGGSSLLVPGHTSYISGDTPMHLEVGDDVFAVCEETSWSQVGITNLTNRFYQGNRLYPTTDNVINLIYYDGGDRDLHPYFAKVKLNLDATAGNPMTEVLSIQELDYSFIGKIFFSAATGVYYRMLMQEYDKHAYWPEYQYIATQHRTEQISGSYDEVNSTTLKILLSSQYKTFNGNVLPANLTGVTDLVIGIDPIMEDVPSGMWNSIEMCCRFACWADNITVWDDAGGDWNGPDSTEQYATYYVVKKNAVLNVVKLERS